MSEPSDLTKMQEYLLALAAAVVTANAYYIHPIIGDVATDLGVSTARIGWVPALNQLALAAGIFLLLPLGDRFSNRSLSIVFSLGQCAGLFAMTLAEGFAMFTIGSTLLGFFTIVPYLLPAYASKRVPLQRLGHVTAILTAGVIFGILVARVGAGVIAEYWHWRAVYWIACGAMAAITIALPYIMEKRTAPESASTLTYFGLLGSMIRLLRSHREIVLTGAIQSIGFGQFIALWLGLALHLTSPEMGYGTDIVGYLAGFAAVSIIATPFWGRFADKFGPRKARVGFAIIQTAGISLLLPFGHSLWLLMLPIIVGNVVGPAIDVTNRMTYLVLDTELRTRLTTIYIVMMFIGGSIGSIAGTAIYDILGWTGTALYVLASSVCLTFLTVFGFLVYADKDSRSVPFVRRS